MAACFLPWRGAYPAAGLALLLVFVVGGAAAHADPQHFDGRAAPPELRLPPVKGEVAPAHRPPRRSVPAFGPELRIYPEAPRQLPEPIVQPLPPPRPVPEVRMPAPVTSCDPNGCWDSSGNRYSGWGPGRLRSDGRLCQQVGNMMHCN